MDTSEKLNKESDGEAMESSAGQRAGQNPDGGHEVPLFMRGGKEGRKGDQQDEKDEVGE